MRPDSSASRALQHGRGAWRQARRVARGGSAASSTRPPRRVCTPDSASSLPRGRTMPQHQLYSTSTTCLQHWPPGQVAGSAACEAAPAPLPARCSPSAQCWPLAAARSTRSGVTGAGAAGEPCGVSLPCGDALPCGVSLLGGVALPYLSAVELACARGRARHGSAGRPLGQAAGAWSSAPQHRAQLGSLMSCSAAKRFLQLFRQPSHTACTQPACPAQLAPSSSAQHRPQDASAPPGARMPGSQLEQRPAQPARAAGPAYAGWGMGFVSAARASRYFQTHSRLPLTMCAQAAWRLSRIDRRAFQTALLHLKPLPKPTCQTTSPAATPWHASMYDSAYQTDADDVLPYLRARVQAPAHRSAAAAKLLAQCGTPASPLHANPRRARDRRRCRRCVMLAHASYPHSRLLRPC